MLLQFSFGNFRSFRDRVTLDMTAATRLHGDPALDAGNVVDVPRTGGVLRVAAIYGANASGKSNIIEAIDSFRRSVALSANTGFMFEVLPFLLNTDSVRAPTSYEIVFLQEGTQYRYGFELLADKSYQPAILNEWLYEAKSSRESLLFERGGEKIANSRHFTEGRGLLYEGRLRRTDTLFLSLMAQNGFPRTKKIWQFITDGMDILSGLDDDDLHDFTVDCLEQERFVPQIRRILREADTGITSVGLMEPEDIDATVDHARELSKRISAAESNNIEEHTRRLMRVETTHLLFNKKSEIVGQMVFPMALSESMGTRKLFAYAAPVFDTLENGNVLFVDEMDARFHPNLTRALVQLFQSPEANPKNAQLIFVTHDTNLLDKRFNRFRRDQIWFVEKDRFGASHLYSLAELKGVRHPSEEDYIRGVYGAIPFLGGMEKLIAEGFDSDAG